jgi:hypothetical protein
MYWRESWTGLSFDKLRMRPTERSLMVSLSNHEAISALERQAR